MKPFCRSAFLASCLFASIPNTAWSTDYEVGPGQAHLAIGDVPWESLMPGDRVLIHWRAAPYQEKWVIGRQGTSTQPIVVKGIPGPGGELPVIDGRDATTRSQLNFWNEVRGVIKIGGSNTPSDTLPSHILLEDLEIRSGRPPYTFTDTDGDLQTYSDNAAGIYVEKGQHITIRGCVVHDSGNGLFIGAFDGDTQDILIERNHFFGNGIVGSAFQHNTYTAAIGIVYRNNRFSSLRAGADGNNLKDRSAGLVVKNNWIEGGNRQLDLVDAEDSAVLVNHPSYRKTFVYGNVLIEPDGEGNSQIVHYGGDSGTVSDYRKGTLYFFNNTLVSTRSGNTTLLRLSTNDEGADVRNNILYVTASGNRLAMLSSAGILDLSHNWLKAGWVDSHGSLTGIIDDDGTAISSADPGFANESTQDFHLAEGSMCLDRGTPQHPDTLPENPLDRQYLAHQDSEPRIGDGALDLGAFERCASAGCGAVFLDGFESGDTSAWTATVF